MLVAQEKQFGLGKKIFELLKKQFSPSTLRNQTEIDVFNNQKEETFDIYGYQQIYAISNTKSRNRQNLFFTDILVGIFRKNETIWKTYFMKNESHKNALRCERERMSNKSMEHSTT